MKVCSKCRNPKPLTEFCKNISKHDGLRCECRACQRIARAAYYAANPEKERTRVAKWAADNPQKLMVMQVASTAKWQAANIEARRIQDQNRRARKLEVGGKLSTDISERLFKLQKGRCACGCKQPLGDDFHRDHIMPLALGGANEDWNIQLLRARCNMSKHAKHPIDFMQSRGLLI